VAALVAGNVLAAATTASAQTTPNDDIRSYVLFAIEELDFKGGQGNHGPSVIDGGNIGVNQSGFIRGNDFRMNVCANAQMVMSDNTMVVSDTMRLGDSSTPVQECDVYEVFNNIPAANNEQSRTGPARAFTPPVIKEAPPFPDFACDPGNPFTVTNGSSATMPPGVYGNVNFQNGTTVTLQPGTYTMCNLTTGQHVTVVNPVGGGVVMQSERQFLINDDMQFDGSDCDTIPLVYVRADGVSSNDNAVRFGQDSEIWGHFFTPAGRLNLGNQTSLHGTFWARAIGSDFNVDVEYCPPPHEREETGTISVTKRLSGDIAGAPPDATYRIAYDCTLPGPGLRDALDGVLTIRAGETLTFTGVQVGTVCNVREVDPPDALPGFVYDPATITPANPINVDSDGQLVEVVVDNPVREVFGTVQVRKLVTGDTGGYVAGTVFGFRLDCDGTAYDTTFTLAGGGNFASGPIRVGTTCTVTETAQPAPAAGFTFLPPTYRPAPPTVTVAAESQVVTVEVTNPVRDLVGRVAVTKVLSGTTEGYVPDSVFEIRLDCDGDAFDRAFRLTAGGTAVVDGVPLGTTCTATETVLPDAAPGYAWGPATITPASVVVNQVDGLFSIAVGNSLTRTSTPSPSPTPTAEPTAEPTDDGGPDVAGTRTGLPSTGGSARTAGQAALLLLALGTGLLLVTTPRPAGRHRALRTPARQGPTRHR
jgi:hypothetical protein